MKGKGKRWSIEKEKKAQDWKKRRKKKEKNGKGGEQCPNRDLTVLTS